jgi:hypothetical protein
MNNIKFIVITNMKCVYTIYKRMSFFFKWKIYNIYNKNNVVVQVKSTRSTQKQQERRKQKNSQKSRQHHTCKNYIKECLIYGYGFGLKVKLTYI